MEVVPLLLNDSNRDMKTVVKKFGGTSVGDISRIRNVARLISDFKIAHPDTRVVAVVSAMAGETNRLIALARSCVREPDPRELDVLTATGEQVSIALLAMALHEMGVPAKSVSGAQARIATDNRFTNAQIQDVDARKIEEILDQGSVPVIAGFQGITEAGDLTTLGRGGSDITAVAVAAALHAEACYIYTDVEGVYSADPRICPQARLAKRISHDEMLEMAGLGAKVLHPRSVYFAMRYHVPLVVLSTFKPAEGTWIVKEEELMEKPVVTGITYRNDEARLTVHKLPGGIQSLNRVFSALSNEGIFIDVISQALVEDKLTDISVTVPDEVSSRALEIAQELVPELHAEGASIDRNIAKVSVIGIGMRHHTGVAARMFEALAKENIDPQIISTSDIKISVIIPRKYCEVAVRSLHEAFIEMKPETAREG